MLLLATCLKKWMREVPPLLWNLNYYQGQKSLELVQYSGVVETKNTNGFLPVSKSASGLLLGLVTSSLSATREFGEATKNSRGELS